MRCLRRRLVPLVAIWLSCQVGTVAFAPIALWASAADSHAHADECTCGHGVGATCPMHHPKGPASPNKHCSIQAAHDSGAAVLASIVGVAGLIPEPTPSLVAPMASMHANSLDVDIRGERPVPPDPPPPRA